MRKAKKKNRVAILVSLAAMLVSLAALLIIINTDLSNRSLEIFPFIGIFIGFIFFILNIGTFIQLKNFEKNMKKIESSHESVSKLYYASTFPKVKTNIYSVVFAIDGAAPPKGLDDYGEFFYLFDEHVENDREFVQAVKISISPSFFSAIHGVNDVLAIVDYIRISPKSNYLLVFDELQRNFGIFPNWLGENIEEIKKDLKLFRITTPEEASVFF